jgi:branched-chain amino acid transport system permease protein
VITEKRTDAGFWTALGIVAAAALLPAVSTPGFITQVSDVVAFTVAFAGLTLLTSHLGLLSLGQAAVVGIGSISALHAVNDVGVPISLMPIVGAVAGGVVGLLLAGPTMRLPGAYLALLTLSVAVAVPIVQRQLDGPLPVLLDGVFIAPSWTGIAAKDEHLWEYWLMMGWAILALLALRGVLRGRTGRALLAARDHPMAAEAFGIPVARTKTFGIVVASAMAGCGGGMILIATNFTDQTQFTETLSIKMFALSIAIGSSRFIGPVLAASVLIMLPLWLDDRAWGLYTGWGGILRSEAMFYVVLLVVTAYVTRGRGFGDLLADRARARTMPGAQR